MLKAAAGVAAAVSVLVVIRIYGFGSIVTFTGELLEGIGAWAVPFYIAIYTVATMISLPGYPFTILAGSFFGMGAGFAISMAATSAAAAVQFLASRYLASSAVRRRLGNNKKFIAIDELAVCRGSAAVALTRLIPLFPFALLNYSFGITGLGFGSYMFWTTIAMVPWTLIYVSGGDSLSRAVFSRQMPALNIIILAVTFITVVILAFWAGKKAVCGRKDPAASD